MKEGFVAECQTFGEDGPLVRIAGRRAGCQQEWHECGTADFDSAIADGVRVAENRGTGQSLAAWMAFEDARSEKNRLGGTFSSSPVLVGEHIFATNEEGKTFIFKADPTAFELVGENQLGNIVFATPTICGGRIYHRVATQAEGQRQEWLYCLGKKGE